jgi:hypothetical protein
MHSLSLWARAGLGGEILAFFADNQAWDKKANNEYFIS